MDKNLNNITEGMFSTIDQIRQDSKDVRDFVKNVFADREFKKMSKDKEFIKYLKSIYEGTMIDEESVYISTRNTNGTITTHIKEEIESVNEGKKRYYQKDGIGKSKYTISYHDGKKKHKDGSDFFDIQIFRNKKDLAKFVNTLHKGGYVYGFGESVNEAFVVAYGKGPKPIKPAFAAYADKKMAQKFMADMKKDGYKVMMTQKKIRGIDESASKLAMGIAGFTGTRGIAVDDFIQKHKIDAKKLFNFVKKGNLKDRMAFVAAIAGRPNNKMFKMITKKFSESVNEDAPCWDTHKQVGMKMKGGKQVPNCVPKNEIKEDKNQIVQLKKKVGKSEIKFYDALSKIEKKLGKKNYRAFLEKGLSDFKINPRHYDYRSNGAAEEKLFNLAK